MTPNRAPVGPHNTLPTDSRPPGNRGLSKAVVIYDSVFGNTETIAEALARGLTKHDVDVECMRVDDLDVQTLVTYDLLAIGGSTHKLGISERMKAFLEALNAIDLSGKHGFCFDTRTRSRFNRFDLNSAAKRIEKKLKRRHVKLLLPHRSALVEGREGPLAASMEETFEQLGVKMTALLR